MLRDPSGKPHAGIAGITFAIYKDQHEGAPLWLETQNVQADVKGNYTVQLGATNPAAPHLQQGPATTLGNFSGSGFEKL